MRAFTLIEVLVGLVIGAIIATAAVATLSQVYQFQSEIVGRNNAARDAELVIDMFGRDLTFAGAGVPRGLRKDVPDFSAPVEPHQLRPLFRAAKPDHIVFVGDLPYPNAELNGFAHLVDLKTFGGTNEHGLAIMSEVSGCVPPSSAPGSYTCSTSAQSLFGAGVLTGADCVFATRTSSRSCPWALNKYQAGSNNVHLVVGTTDGGWYEREQAFVGAQIEDEDPYLVLHPEHGSGDGNGFVLNGDADDTDLVAAELLVPAGSAFIAHIDRVFWSFEATAGGACVAPPNCVLRRRQCWGMVDDPGAADWPVIADAPFRSDRTPLHCDPLNNDGTGWETVMTGVDAFTLQYFDSAGVALTGAWDAAQSARVKAVHVELALTRPVVGTNRTMLHRVQKQFFIENRGGLLNTPAASGGCNPSGDEGGCGGDD